MALPKPEIGLVIRLAYLWSHDYYEGRSEASKDRPCVIVSCTNEGRVFVFPITHSSPREADTAIELPPRVKAHLGLDEAPSWIIIDECNSFDWPGYDMRPMALGRFDYGHLPPRLFDRIRQAVAKKIQINSLKITPRT